MAELSPEARELARVTEAYRKAIDDVMALEISDVLRVARLLEIEATFMGMLAAAREAVERSRGPTGKPN